MKERMKEWMNEPCKARLGKATATPGQRSNQQPPPPGGVVHQPDISQTGAANATHSNSARAWTPDQVQLGPWGAHQAQHARKAQAQRGALHQQGLGLRA